MAKKSVAIYAARGIGEGILFNTVVDVINRVQKTIGSFDVHKEQIDYPAQYGPVPTWNGQSFINSLNDLYQQVQYKINQRVNFGDEDNSWFILVGYSAGADGMGNIAKHLPSHIAPYCLGVFLIADPSMPRMKGLGPKYGIRGERTINGINTVKWYFDPNDPIPLAWPAPNPTRVLADKTPWLSLALPALIPAPESVRIMQQMSLRRMQNYAINPFDINATKVRYEKAFDELARYLVKGDHSNYINRSPIGGKLRYTAQAAADITEAIARAG